MEKNHNEEQSGLEQRSKIPSFDEYFSMNEQEKDRSIERSVARLQNRILQIMYLVEQESNSSVKPTPVTQPNDQTRDTN